MEENTQDNSTTELNLAEIESIEAVLATTAECNHCGWKGNITDTKFENGIFYCPSCSQEFSPPADDHVHDEESN
jgi:ribosomal protein L37AE/L43A